MCDDSCNDSSDGEVVTAANSLANRSRVNWARKDSEKINKYVSDWDNVTGDCVDENGIHFENNRLNMEFLAEKNGVPILTLDKYLFSDLSKRRVIGDGVGGKSLLSKKYYDFYGQVEARYDRVNNGLARREIIDLVQ